MAVDVAQLLSFTVKNNASDLHLSGGVPPMIRVDGDIKRINMPALTHKDVNSTSPSRFPSLRVSASTPTTRTAARLQSFASSRRKS
jgi:Tfp pilus assembly pilus retraction ATPase PilT